MTICEVHFTAFVNGPTDHPAALFTMLRAITSDPLLAPTHGSRDERTRMPFDAAAIAAAGQIGDPILWRLQRPKWWGSIGASPLPLARVILPFDGLASEDIAAVGEALVRFVDRLQPAYAALHFKWAEGNDEQLASLKGLFARDIQVCRFGFPGVFAWTWFGPELTASFGLGPLLALGATPMGRGGASLPLVDAPWTASFEELRERQQSVDAVLRPKGLFGDYSRIPKKGPQWIPRKRGSTPEA